MKNQIFTQFFEQYSTKTSAFNGENYYIFLSRLILEEIPPAKEVLIGDWIDKFFICTDIIDDIIDKDNSDLEPIIDLDICLPIFLNKVLTNIQQLVSQTNFSCFADYISKALLSQQQEIHHTLSTHTDESTYFHIIIKQSVYLLQSILVLVDSKAPQSAFNAVQYLAFFSQIKNDVEDILQPVSKDLLYLRPTLPLIKTLRYALQNNEISFLEVLNSQSEGKISQHHVNKLLYMIDNSNSLEDCAELALYYFKLAERTLLHDFPEKEKIIISFFNSLKKDETN